MTTSRAAERLRSESPQWITDLKYRWPARYRASWIALVVLLLIVGPVVPRALSAPSVELVSALAGVLILAALGQMLIIMVGALDLSVGAIVSVAAGMVVHYGGEGANVAGVIAGAVLVSVLLSLANGVMISLLRLNPLIVTLATFGIITGAIRLWTGVSLSVTGQAPEALTSFAQPALTVFNAVFLYALVVAVLLSLLLTKTRYGRHIAFVGSNRRAARALGMSIVPTELGTFAIAGLLYGVAGVLLAGFLGTPDVQSGAIYQLSTITVAGIAGVMFGGGPASVASVVSASAFLQMLDQGLAILGLGAGSRVMVQGFVLVVAVGAITLAQYSASGLSRGIGLRRRRPSTG
ncbi:ribose transport system permease protein [Kribbella sp. VKM Ac-2527]|uniref:Autoinducer 2 import system permease protein LsrC n=1 Tax=Kribbella caucasensis TaxID=2512215 RepID=A0A4R6KKX6_9ACTN|nr:ABC transporter permease [Kribbella sp. VKM Ac-2527]TDO51651.1 ribose transport system permease protein [Kribbella sp. VKM Ac-2527]